MSDEGTTNAIKCIRRIAQRHNRRPETRAALLQIANDAEANLLDVRRSRVNHRREVISNEDADALASAVVKVLTKYDRSRGK